MKLVVFGLSLSSSWGNGHATTYRALLKAFAARGHDIDFYEWDAPWYESQRDLLDPAFCTLEIYEAWDSERDRALAAAREADAVLVGSYVRDGATVIDDLAEVVGEKLFFFDIDTPVTVSSLRRSECEFLRVDQVPLFRRYFSFAGGPILSDVLEGELGAREAHALYCCVDADLYGPAKPDPRFIADLAYMGTYAEDRQPGLERLMLEPASLLPSRTFLVAGPQYPESISWPEPVRRHDHVGPSDHAAFYSSAHWQLNLTRSDMRNGGWSPSVRLFEAAACGAPIMSDRWPGLSDFLEPGLEILLPESAEEVVHLLEETHADDRRATGAAARRRILGAHTSEHRARELEALLATSDFADASPEMGATAGN